MGTILMHFTDLVAAGGTGGSGIDSTTGEGLASALRNFVGPILMIVIGIVAITFLFKRQLTQFFQFMALAILVALLFYTPGVLPAIAGWVSNLFGVEPGTTSAT